MEAALFARSAQAAAGPLLEPGARVGERIEAAVAATWGAVGCNTNLGIVLLCAPIARAIERCPRAGDPVAWQAAIRAVLEDLDLGDARAAYRAIAMARPGGLGSASAQDVHGAPPSVDLRTAMALAADRDSIARQYADGYAELFELGWPVASPGLAGLAPAALAATVQGVYLAFLATLPDSHIVRKHGLAVAHTVMRSAQAWRSRAQDGLTLDTDPGFAAWDVELKAAGLNPGTSADFTVATLFARGLSDRPFAGD
jgi:triphosphoribosyl-dephospho-CoA synthase